MIDPRAAKILDTIRYITIASVSPNCLPHNTPVFAAHDTKLNFYFGTHKGSQKARNILQNPNIFVVIYDSTVFAGEGLGVYLQATASQITDPTELAAGHKLLWDRRDVPYWKLEEFAEPTPLVMFKVTPIKAWLNGGGRKDGHYIDTREEISMLN